MNKIRNLGEPEIIKKESNSGSQRMMKEMKIMQQHLQQGRLNDGQNK